MSKEANRVRWRHRGGRKNRIRHAVSSTNFAARRNSSKVGKEAVVANKSNIKDQRSKINDGQQPQNQPGSTARAGDKENRGTERRTPSTKMKQYRLHAGNLRYHVSSCAVAAVCAFLIVAERGPSLKSCLNYLPSVQHMKDFPKLRELHKSRLIEAASRTSLLPNQRKALVGRHALNCTVSGQVQRQQQRSFFNLAGSLGSGLENLQLKRLESAANANPSDSQAQYEFLNKLAHSHPEAVIDRVSHPMFSHFALDQRIALLYLQALSRTQRYSRFSLKELSTRLQLADGNVPGLKEYVEEAQKLTKPEQVAGLVNLLAGGAGGVGIAGLGAAASATSSSLALQQSRGTDPRYPLHVQLHNPTSARAAFIALTGRVLVAFVVVSALSALLDEKGVGRGLGMNSGGKHIQQAQDTSNVSFDDVKGVEEAKAELQEIVMYLKNPTKFTRLGGKLPRGLLLTGAPGTGKTLLAKAIAGEADVPFFFSSGSQFEEVYVGLGAKRIRELFEAAKKKSPCIIFIDEIDAVGGTRKLKDQSALKMTLNELLVQMDGFEDNNGIIVIGATNFMESLDAALLRPGRFDKHITVPLPDVGGRKEILEMYAKKTKLHPNVDLNVLARGTTGFSGADLYNLMNQAALKASVDGLSSITMSVLEYAKDKILMGAERKTAVITEETARCTAYHEAGHALVAVLTDGAMPSKCDFVVETELSHHQFV